MQLHHHAAGLSPIVALLGTFPDKPLPSLRAATESEIDRLIGLLDEWDGDPDAEDSADSEPHLGWHGNAVSFSHDDREADAGDENEVDEDHEPSLAHPENQIAFVFRIGWNGRNEEAIVTDHGDQSRAALGNSRDLEEAHDGREPDESGIGDQDGLWEDGGREPELGWTAAIDQTDLDPQPPFWAVTDSEPSLGWTERGGVGFSADEEACPRDDREDDSGDDRETCVDKEYDLGWSNEGRQVNLGAGTDLEDDNDTGIADDASLRSLDLPHFPQTRRRTDEERKQERDIFDAARRLAWTRMGRDPDTVTLLGPGLPAAGRR